MSYGEPWGYDDISMELYSTSPQGERFVLLRPDPTTELYSEEWWALMERAALCVNSLKCIRQEALETGALPALVAALRQAHDLMDDHNAAGALAGVALCNWCPTVGYDVGGVVHEDDCPMLAMRAALAPFAGLEVGP